MSASRSARENRSPTPPSTVVPAAALVPAVNGHAPAKRMGARAGTAGGEEFTEVWTDDEEAAATGLFQILDETGQADPARVPALSPEELRQMYTGMLRSRLLDQRLLPLQRQGRIGFYIGATGQEAGVIAGAHAIGPEDWFVPGLRETSAALYRGLPAAHAPGAGLRQQQRPRPGAGRCPATRARAPASTS